MHNIHNRFLYSGYPIGGLKYQLKERQPRCIYSGTIRNIFPLNLRSESGDKFAESSRMDITQVNEAETEGERAPYHWPAFRR